MLSFAEKRNLILFLDGVAVALCVSAKCLSSLMMDKLSGCSLYETYGIKCLTCGGTRCVNALSRGEIAEAFGYNAFVPIAFALAFFVLVLMNAGWLFGSEKANKILSRLCDLRLLTAGCIVTAIYMLSRNIIPVISRI